MAIPPIGGLGRPPVDPKPFTPSSLRFLSNDAANAAKRIEDFLGKSRTRINKHQQRIQEFKREGIPQQRQPGQNLPKQQSLGSGLFSKASSFLGNHPAVGIGSVIGAGIAGATAIGKASIGANAEIDRLSSQQSFEQDVTLNRLRSKNQMIRDIEEQQKVLKDAIDAPRRFRGSNSVVVDPERNRQRVAEEQAKLDELVAQFNSRFGRR